MTLLVRLRAWAIAFLVMAVSIAGCALVIRQMMPHYPYGRSHCCDKILYLALLRYADTNNGWFPRGEESPEASLSLLYRMDPTLLETLPGKTIPENVVRARLEGGELLTPETCGWHYVDGLRNDDNPRIALFWDKAGLGHNGETLPEGGHYVCFRNGIEYIKGAQWPAFLKEQEELLSQIKDLAKRRAVVRKEPEQKESTD